MSQIVKIEKGETYLLVMENEIPRQIIEDSIEKFNKDTGAHLLVIMGAK